MKYLLMWLLCYQYWLWMVFFLRSRHGNPNLYYYYYHYLFVTARSCIILHFTLSGKMSISHLWAESMYYERYNIDDVQSLQQFFPSDDKYHFRIKIDKTACSILSFYSVLSTFIFPLAGQLQQWQLIMYKSKSRLRILFLSSHKPA